MTERPEELAEWLTLGTEPVFLLREPGIWVSARQGIMPGHRVVK